LLFINDQITDCKYGFPSFFAQGVLWGHYTLSICVQFPYPLFLIQLDIKEETVLFVLMGTVNISLSNLPPKN